MEIVMEQQDLGVSTDAEGWVRRRKWWIFVVSVLAAIIALFWTGLIVLAAATADSAKEAARMLGMGIVVFGFPIFASARAALRMPRAGVRISAEDVVVVGPLWTWRVNLHKAIQFVPGRQRSWYAGELLRGTYGVLLERRSGSPVPIWGLRSTVATTEEGLEEGRTSWQPVCDHLNALLAATKGEEPQRSDPAYVRRPY
jgi:hypothetical protein